MTGTLFIIQSENESINNTKHKTKIAYQTQLLLIDRVFTLDFYVCDAISSPIISNVSIKWWMICLNLCIGKNVCRVGNPWDHFTASNNWISVKYPMWHHIVRQTIALIPLLQI